MKKIVKKLIVSAILALLTGIHFFLARKALIEELYRYEYWDRIEKILYVLFAVFIGTIYKYIYDVLKKIPAKIFVSLGLSAVYTVGVFFANNYFHYLEWNAIRLGWRFVIPYIYFLKRDLAYSYGNGEYRYILIFLAMCLANLAIVAYFKWCSPNLKIWIQEAGLWYFGPNEKTIKYKIERWLDYADYSDFVDEINEMPITDQSKNMFIKLINHYEDDGCKIIELYLGLFIRFCEYLTREEYLEYRQRYLDNFDEPLPDECEQLDELFEYKDCGVESVEETAD